MYIWLVFIVAFLSLSELKGNERDLTQITLNIADPEVALYYARKTADPELIKFLQWRTHYTKECRDGTRFDPQWPHPPIPPVKVSYQLDYDSPYTKCSFKDRVFHSPLVKNNNYYQPLIKEAIAAREYNLALKVANYLDKESAQIIRLRIALLRRQKMKIEEILPFLGKDHELLADFINWHRKLFGFKEELLNYLDSYSEPSKHWQIKKAVARDIFTDNHKDFYQDSYKLALSRAEAEKNINEFSEGEWLAGWIALKFLKNPQLAYQHFIKMYNNVKSPLSLGRAAYWAARAAEEMPNSTKALRWYKIAATYKMSFYGQMAAARNSSEFKTGYTSLNYSQEDLQNYNKNKLARAAYYALRIDPKFAEPLIESAIKQAKSVGEAILIARDATEGGRPHLALKAARAKPEYYQGGKAYDIFYPTSYHDSKNIELEPALILSVIRQESMFDHEAKSHAGACGLMQLMPSTAKFVAKNIGLQYNISSLVDPHYNINLGNAYLKQMLNYYNDSIVLALCAYNAGPHNTNRWIATFGDPTKLSSVQQLIDWIEMIPFNETRNYVQRVIENLFIYRQILKHHNPDTLQVAYAEESMIGLK